MRRRCLAGSRAKALLGLVAIVLTTTAGVLAVPAVAPVGAVTRSFALAVPAGEGALQIRGADESQPLGTPTTIAGTVDDETGVISGATFSTPPIEFDTVSGTNEVHVTATFTQVGAATGLVSATPGAPEGEGTVVLRTSVEVTLDLDINDGDLIQQCKPQGTVSLEFVSDGPYTEAEGGLIADPNFTVPPVPADPGGSCAVSGQVNDLLAGPGHSLRMYIEGDLPVPPIKLPTETTLAADPSEGSVRGAPVTLTASVAPAEAHELDPTGTIVFKEGTRELGAAEVQPDGTATLTTTELRAGDQQLTAQYQGDGEFSPSVSDPLVYSVAPAPIVTGTLPEFVVRGAEPVEFDITIDNRGSSQAVTNGRVDVLVPGINEGQLFLDRQLPDGSWAPLTFSFSPNGLYATLGPDEGTVVPADGVQTHHLRISAASNATLRSVDARFSLVGVDPGPGEDATMATTTWSSEIIHAERLATTTQLGMWDPAPLRPGQTLTIDATVASPTTGEPATTGQVEFLIDGKVVPFRPQGELGGQLPPEQTRATIDTNGMAYARVGLPSDLSTGPHILEARYLGDDSYLPSESQQVVLQVLGPLGPLYTCDFSSTVGQWRMGAYVQAHVRLLAHAEDGEELDLEDVEVTVIPGGIDTMSVLPMLTDDGNGHGADGIEIDLGGAGTIVGDAVAYEMGSVGSDQLVRLQNLEGTIIVDGEPGEVMALPIEQIEIEGVDWFDSRFTFTCTPDAEPVVLDEVRVAGVSLVAETSTDLVRTGDEVVLTATAAPASPTGVVEFFSGAQSLGTASAASGTATLTVNDLPAGTNLLTARYTGVGGGPYQSNIVELQVGPETECPGFTDEGSGRVVRLVYLELLQRCPDQAGYDYWVGELDDGVSPEAFANTIAKTFEARKVFVDKAYRLMFDRPAEPGGKAYWAGELADGRFDRLVADLGASPEFWANAGGTNDGFVRLVYQRILRREASAGDVDYWAGRLQRGESRRTLVRTLFNLSEPLSVVVGDAYREILGRDPSAAETTAGVTLLRTRSNLSALYGQLIGTPEFRTRAETLPNPED